MDQKKLNDSLISCQALAIPVSKIEIVTPATRKNSKYALLPARAVTELSPGGVKMLGIFASLERKDRSLKLTATERLQSTGMSQSGFYRARNELITGGWMHSDYSLPLFMRPHNVANSGWYARVNVERWSVLPPQICRAITGLALYKFRHGKKEYGSYRLVARFLRISTRTLRRHLAAAKAFGLKVARFAQVRFRASRPLQLSEVIPASVRQVVPQASGLIIGTGNSTGSWISSLVHSRTRGRQSRDNERPSR